MNGTNDQIFRVFDSKHFSRQVCYEGSIKTFKVKQLIFSPFKLCVSFFFVLQHFIRNQSASYLVHIVAIFLVK